MLLFAKPSGNTIYGLRKIAGTKISPVSWKANKETFDERQDFTEHGFDEANASEEPICQMGKLISWLRLRARFT